MKSKDLKVGTDYAVKERWGDTYRATVLEVGVTHTEKHGAYRVETHSNMVKVKCVTNAYPAVKGEVRYVRPQALAQTWSEEHAQRTALGKARAERDRQEQAERTQRAVQAFALHEALVAKGAKVGVDYTTDDEDYAALLAAGFKPAEELKQVYSSLDHVQTALNGLGDLMRKGKVNLDQMAFLLDLSPEAPRPEDSLDDYDLDEEA